MSDQPSEEINKVENENGEVPSETENSKQENSNEDQTERRQETNDQSPPPVATVEEKDKQNEQQAPVVTREERESSLDQPTATIEIKEESTPEKSPQQPLTENKPKEVKEIPPAPQNPTPEPIRMPQESNNSNNNNSNPFGGWTSWFTSKVETSLQTFTDFIVPPIDSNSNTPKAAATTTTTSGARPEQQQQQEPPPPPPSSSSTTASTTTAAQQGQGQGQEGGEEEVPLIPESARLFINKLLQKTNKVAESVQHKVEEIAHNVQEEGIMNAGQHVLNDLGDKLKEVSHQVTHTLLPTPSPEIDNDNDNEENSDPLSFQSSFIRIKGYDTVKVINNLKESIESDLASKLGLLSPAVSNIYDATFTTIDNELKNISPNAEFKITEEEESKWIWVETNEYKEMIGSVNGKIDKFINNIKEQLLSDGDNSNNLNENLKDYLNQILPELQTLVLTLYTSITLLYMKIILQVALYYSSKDDSSYLNPSQAVRLSEIIRFHFQEYSEEYSDFINFMHSISFEKMVDSYFNKHEKKEEDADDIRRCQDVFDNYLKLLDSQSKTLIESKKEIFSPLVKSQMINGN